MATPAILSDAPVPSDLPQAPPPARKPQRSLLWLHVLLLIFTCCTTTAIGMRYMANFRAGQFPISTDADIFPYSWAWSNLHLIATGIPFSGSLLAILLTHEFGHYFAARHYGVRATLPFLLPAPSLSGTAGAVIQLKSRVKSRAALIAIGAFGPLCGFAVAIVVALIGISLSTTAAAAPTQLLHFRLPLLIQLLIHATGKDAVFAGPVVWHPVFIAAWIGVLITALNLVPAGQFDGGHILYAISPRAHKLATRLMIGVLAVMGVLVWVGWLLWAGLLLLPGMRHPKVNDHTPLAGWQKLLGPACLVILVLAAVPQPFEHWALADFIHKVKFLLR